MQTWQIILGALGLLFFVACGAAEPEPTPTPTLTREEQAGKKVFIRDCGACHSTAADTVIVGPSLFGVTERADERVSGLDARGYLYTSVLRPEDYLVDGFDNLMPNSFGKTLTGEELDAVIAYLYTLK